MPPFTSEGVTGPDPALQKKGGHKIQSAGQERQSDPIWDAEYPGCSVESLGSSSLPWVDYQMKLLLLNPCHGQTRTL